MPLFEVAIPIALGLVTLALVVRYLYWSADRETARLGKLESDEQYRRQTIAELDESLAAHPGNTKSLRLRADLRRFEKDWQGVAEDLRAYLAHKPSDDTAWHELSEALLETGRADESLSAAREAVKLDAAYIDYQTQRCRAALLAGNVPEARDALDAWRALALRRLDDAQGAPRRYADWPSPIPPHRDAWLHMHDAATCLAEGDEAAAQKALETARQCAPAPEDLAEDPVLAGLAALRT